MDMHEASHVIGKEHKALGMEGRLFSILVAILLCSSCSTTPAKTAIMESAAPRVEASASEVRTRIRSQIGTFSGLFDQSLDELIKASPEPSFRRRLLVFKMDALSKLQQAMLHADPFVAFIDTWAFVVQVQDFVRKFADRPELHEARERAMKGFARMEAKLEDIDRAIAGNVDITRQEVYKRARTHPLSEEVRSRATTEDLFAAFLSNTGTNAFKVVGSLPETVDDAMARIDLYAEYLPKQARWQAELIAGDLITREGKDLLQELAYVPQSLERITQVVEDMPELVSSERGEVLKVLRAELDKAIEAFRRERLETLAFVRDERLETLGFVREERMALSGLFSEQVSQMLKALSQERTVILAETEEMRTRLVKDLAKQSRALIDHFVLRLAQLVGAVLVVLGFFLIVVLRFMRRKQGLKDMTT